MTSRWRAAMQFVSVSRELARSRTMWRSGSGRDDRDPPPLTRAPAARISTSVTAAISIDASQLSLSRGRIGLTRLQHQQGNVQRTHDDDGSNRAFHPDAEGAFQLAGEHQSLPDSEDC